MGRVFKENIVKITSMAKEYTFFLIKDPIREAGSKALCMGKASSNGLMGEAIRGPMWQGRKKAKGNLCGQTEKN